MITEIREITNSDDLIDVRDVIARVEQLEDEITDELDGDERYVHTGRSDCECVGCAKDAM